MTFKLIVLLATLSIALNSALAQTPPPPQPKIVGAPEIIIDRNTGTGHVLLTLRNTNDAKLENLALTGLVSTSSGIKPAITFKAPPSDKTNPVSDKSTCVEEGELVYKLADMEPNTVSNVVVVATRVAEDGEFDVELRNKDDVFGTLKIIRLPFGVTLDGPNPNEADLSMVGGSLSTLTLKNNDQVPYPIHWRLWIDGKEVCGDKLTLAAKGIGLLRCQPSVSFSPTRVQDLFKVTSTKGHSLLLYPEKEGWFDQSSPWKTIPVTASLSYFGKTSQEIWGYLVILAVLIAGGVTSLVLSQALPNRLKRLNIKERLRNIGVSTSNLSSNIGSRLQVGLRLERNRLFDELESRNTFSPDFAGIATRCNEDTDKLEARVALVQQMDVVLGRLEQKMTLAPPPSQISDIEGLIDDAKAILMKAQLTPKDLEAAQTAITEAGNKVDKLNQEDPTFGENLAKRALEVQQDLTTLANNPTFVRVMKILPGANTALQSVTSNTTRIAPANYGAVDMAVEKMLLIKDYVLLIDGTLDQEILARLQAREDRLFELLQLQSCAAMSSARLLLRQMKGDVYPERIKEKLLAGAATIVVEPLVAYDKAPLEFCVSFHSEEIDEAAAKEQWKCEWDFGDRLKGTDWTASHYFLLAKQGRFKAPLAQDYTVRVTFRDSNGDPLLDSGNNPVFLEKVVSVQPTRRERLFGDRARTELLKLMAALLIAVFALVSGTREQLLQLDILPGLIAVFLVGFGADTIKNLLTKTEST
jgi:hypothetical protein